MGNVYWFQKLCQVQIMRLLYVLGIIFAVIVLVFHMFAFPYASFLSPAYMGNSYVKMGSVSFLNSSISSNASAIVVVHGKVNHGSNASVLDTQVVYQQDLGPDGKGKVDVLSSGVDEEESSNFATGVAENRVVAASAAKISTGFATQHPVLKRREAKPMSIAQMKSLLLKSSASDNSVRPRRTSKHDQELQNARLEIENAPIIRNVPEAHASAFRNYSMFRRSYQLMERLLKVYVYREGDKPIFHQPYMRGIYSSEGWFMKLMEANKQFVVKDARKAHLFYLPFSSQKLRNALNEQNFTSQKDLENHLKKYVSAIAKKYRYWNRTMGADHFLVACHDWAPRLTRNHMSNCLRALCNTNIARGFKIGKDVSLPVTYIRSAENPVKDVGGNPSSNRPILAFFAGGMHGYLRPVLLEYWKNKESDMKIFGPMPRDIEGKARYRDFMKTSRYCICARGYEVHTPRVVESIYYGCVPVIISDNYVPPFFEVLDWEAFSVFIPEKHIPNLRSILLSISEEKYIAMHQRLRAVQQHFLWHKNPLKYDIFHMILHSIWYNRVFQVSSG